MTKYRKKPIIVEAYQWITPKNFTYKGNDIIKPYTWCGPGMMDAICECCGKCVDTHGWIDYPRRRSDDEYENLSGHAVCPGDWIVTNPDGEVWVCKPPNIFEQTYEKVEETPGPHVKALEETLEQFDSYPQSRCSDCKLPHHAKLQCLNYNLSCREKLFMAARERDDE